MIEPRLRSYIFERHSESEIRSWNKRLNYFRYFRAFGGHANDGDSLDLAIRYSGNDQLLNIFRLLNIKAEIFDAKPPQPEFGKSYSGFEFALFPSLIKNTRWMKQPGWINIMNEPAFVWAHEDHVILTAGPRSYEVNEERVECAVKIERSVDFASVKDMIIDPPKNTPHYVSPVYYPELFE